MKTVTGNLITLAKDNVFNVIVHGCNCYCAMGAGIAPQIAAAFPGETGPEAVDARTEPGDLGKLGDFSVGTWTDEEYRTIFIINAYTQGDKSRTEQMTDYDAVRSCFSKIAKSLRLMSAFTPRVGYPMIGAGLGGGDWEVISKIIDEELEGFDHTLVEWDGT